MKYIEDFYNRYEVKAASVAASHQALKESIASRVDSCSLSRDEEEDIAEEIY